MCNKSKIDQQHICKSCRYWRRLKLFSPCDDCFHNKVIIPKSGDGKCCFQNKLDSIDRSY